MLRVLLGLFAVPLFLCEAAALRDQPFTAWVLVNIALFPLVMLVSVALHEGGHLLAARAVGLQAPRVQIGLGRPLVRWRAARTLFTLHALPLVGMTYVGGRPAGGVRWRRWLSVAAGPAVTIAIVLAAVGRQGWPGVGEVLLPSGAFASRLSLPEMAGAANAWMLFWNLLPLPVLRHRGFERNDGYQLLTVPFLPQRHLDVMELMPRLLDADDLCEKDDYEGAATLIEGLRARFPASWPVLNALAIVQLHRGQLAEARSSFLALLETEAPLPEMPWMARNNLAWVNYRLRDDALRTEADVHSAAVHGRYKHAAWALGTRGAVLGWLGRRQEAIPLLERAYLLNSRSKDRALNAAGLAVVLAAHGQAGQAAAWVARARSNDASCPLLPEAEAALLTAAGR
jgi:hypothetical protein